MNKRARSSGPSSGELRLRGELDKLRRELSQLRRRARDEQRAGTAPTPASRDAGGDANGTSPVEGPHAQDEPAPVPAADDAVAEAGSPVASEEPTRLREQIGELTSAKQRLSRLYFTQLEENRKRQTKLHQILQNISEINSELDLDALLERIAGTIRSSLGFRVVLIRIREPRTSMLKARAFAGVEPAAREALERQEVSIDDFLSWLRDDFKVSRSYFISHSHAFNRELPQGYVHDTGPREEWEWHPDDVLLVPLFGRDGELVAYFSVDDPDDRLVPSREVVELLEIFGQHAVVAIENARLYRQLERHSLELEEAQRLQNEMHHLKTNFVSTISHELRTPLTAIRAYVDLLMASREGEIPHGQLQHFLSIINEESQRLSRLIESVLDLNRFDSGGARLARQTIDLGEVVDETMRMLQPVAQVGQVQLKTEIRCADTRLDANRDQMRQMALHLGSNAVKFTPAGGVVTLVLTGDDRDIALEVIDTGIGIPAEALERIFERFYQVDSSLVRRYGGTGLGLAICKSIAEWHGGRIVPESAPGKGSRFVVRLPRRPAPRVIVRPGAKPEAAAEDILRLAIEMVAEVMNARIVSLLCPDAHGELLIRAAMGLDEDVVRSARVRFGSGVAGHVAQHRRPVVVSGSEMRREVSASGRELYRSRTFLSVPIEHQGELLGVLSVTDPLDAEPFGAEHCHLLLQLASRVAAAWTQTLDMQERQADVQDAANTLRQVLKHLERGRRHAPDRVRLARALARELGLDESEVGVVSFAASVHDIGMRQMGEQVEGGGTLSDDDREALERHPEASAEMLAPLETVGVVRDVVLAHHEWWDGTGYPRGLSGERIPIGGRILAVVDAYESMTVGRSHRPARGREQALAEIQRLRGQQFDPRVADAFPRALEHVERTTGGDGSSTAATALDDARR